MNTPVITVENLSKEYQLGEKEEYGMLRESIVKAIKTPIRRLKRIGKPANRQVKIWALKDVSFDVHEGEVVGIIGRNGAGKSTLLKILSRITEPTDGRVKIHGKVGSLLEVGTGFHPELTGRENIYLNGAILGMKKSWINHKFDEIVDFAEIEKFIDTPVKRYSSGMYVRLAFAVAAHLEPEILLVDEVLAVGDAIFQKKCLGKIGDVVKEGRTVLFVSHNMASVQNLCGRCFLIEKGKIILDGPTDSVVAEYLSAIQDRAKISLRDRLDREGGETLRFVNFHIESPTRGIIDTICVGETATLVAEYESNTPKPLKNVSVSISIFNNTGQHMITCWTRMTAQDFEQIASKGQFKAHIQKFPLMPGRYTMNLWCEANGIVVDWVREAMVIDVIEGDFFGTGQIGPRNRTGVIVEHDWSYKAI
jgi:lipopolysaccharide transport system ATP-binding protein